MNDKPTRAVLRALAYVHITGQFPSHIHFRTRWALRDMIQTDYGTPWHQVLPEYVELAEAQPLVQACRVLERLGCRCERPWLRRYRKASFISYDQLDQPAELPEGHRRDVYATAHASGHFYFRTMDRDPAEKDGARWRAEARIDAGGLALGVDRVVVLKNYIQTK